MAIEEKTLSECEKIVNIIKSRSPKPDILSQTEDSLYIIKLQKSLNLKKEKTNSKEEEEERKWYEIDKRALEDIVYYNRKCLDKFYIEERIKNYEEKQKIKEQIKEKYKSIFDAVDKLFA